jgi:hypothetical protein
VFDLAVLSVVALGDVKPGVAAVFVGVLTGDGALGAGVSTPPNEKPDLAAGVVVVGAGVEDDAESLDASLVVVAPPKLNPPPGAEGAADSDGFDAAVPPNAKPPVMQIIVVCSRACIRTGIHGK